MANLDGFDASTVEPTGDFAPIPNGEYLAMMIDSEFKKTKNGNGEYLQCCFEIVDGEHKARRLWDRLNLKNQNETSVKIAQSTLSAICHAVGIMKPQDSAELHGKPLKIKVVAEERDDKPGVFKNEIKGYESVNGKAVPPSQPAVVPGKPPWKR